MNDRHVVKNGSGKLVPCALDFVSNSDFLGSKAASAPRTRQFIVFAMRYRRKKQGCPMILQTLVAASPYRTRES
jgi:hypothetical protein